MQEEDKDGIEQAEEIVEDALVALIVASMGDVRKANRNMFILCLVGWAIMAGLVGSSIALSRDGVIVNQAETQQ